MTETELRLIASAAIIGDNSLPVNGYSRACGQGNAERVIDKGEGQVLPHVADGLQQTARVPGRCRAGRP